MQTTRMTDRAIVRSNTRAARYERAVARTVARLRGDVIMRRVATRKDNARKVDTQSLVAEMRARMAERFGPLAPEGRRGWTA